MPSWKQAVKDEIKVKFYLLLLLIVLITRKFEEVSTILNELWFSNVSKKPTFGRIFGEISSYFDYAE